MLSATGFLLDKTLKGGKTKGHCCLNSRLLSLLFFATFSFFLGGGGGGEGNNVFKWFE